MEGHLEAYTAVHSRYRRVSQGDGLDNMRNARKWEWNGALPWTIFNNGGMYRAIATSACRKGSLKPQASMRSNWSCNSLVRFGPTAPASIPTHWNIGSSEGAFFRLSKLDEPLYNAAVTSNLPSSLKSQLNAHHNRI
jgi:hypothetical protein